MNNRIKRVSIVVALVLSCGALPVAASYATGIVRASDGDVYVDGYINGASCNFNPFTYDSINYNAWLRGSDASLIPDKSNFKNELP